ncbi:MAG: hypothetical protein KKC75_02445 [Nanoarchaeota archaeon]|nr:hypothetical protein [Nanoarchaeota archaeon]MBU1004661.1 hypothetical protein [Nanoarchaeota archaeon]MBU1945725.1 hypothetical protein [Nanoarchaeota archaeon]
MNIEKHLERLKESIEVIDESITKDITKRQRTIGFSVSAASADMFEIFLHKNKLIDPGFIVKHEWFKSKNKIKDKFPFDFKGKEKILELMYYMEERRDPLCYGTPKPESYIKEVISRFNELKKIFKDKGVALE